MISRSTIDRVFETARVEEVIGEFVQLKKAGSNFKGFSPFTDEQSPSFMVSPRYFSILYARPRLKKITRKCVRGSNVFLGSSIFKCKSLSSNTRIKTISFHEWYTPYTSWFIIFKRSFPKN